MDRYTVIYADPPWPYRDKARAGERGVEYKYPVMRMEDIEDLPVSELAAESCALFMWVTPPLLPEGLRVVKAWGFKFKTIAFTWVKTNPRAGNFSTGMGHYTRANAEPCLLGIKGKSPARHNMGVKSLVIAPRGRHSQKPDVVRERIVELFGDVPRVELFARQRAAGWHAWGNETIIDIELFHGHFRLATRRGRPLQEPVPAPSIERAPQVDEVMNQPPAGSVGTTELGDKGTEETT